MADSWLQLVGACEFTTSGKEFVHSFPELATSRMWRAFPALEREIAAEFDGDVWLRQSEYRQVTINLWFQREEQNTPVQFVASSGVLYVRFPVVWPELEDARVGKIREHLRPVVLDILRLVGEWQQFEALPQLAAAETSNETPRRPSAEPDFSCFRQRDDAFVIARDFPPGTSPEAVAGVVAQYEEELSVLLSELAMARIEARSSSPAGAQWDVKWAADPES